MLTSKSGLDSEAEITKEAASYVNSYVIRPNYKQKFRPSTVNAIMKQILHDKLTSCVYQAETCSLWTKEIADEIKQKLKDLALDRYKYVVHVVIGELKGEGLKINCRCFWDPDSDGMAQEVFKNDYLFCVAVAYGVFYY